MTVDSDREAWVADTYVVMAVLNRLALTRRCLDSLRAQSIGAPRVVVTDDASTDGTPEVLAREFPEVTVLEGSGNDWWGHGTNRALRHALAAGAKRVLLLNNDTELAEDCLSRLYEASQANPGALIGCSCYDLGDGSLIYAGARLNWSMGEFETPFDDSGGEETVEVTHLPGRGMFVPAEVFRDIGFIDADKFPQRYGDFDFSHRAYRAGYRVLVCRSAIVHGHRAESSGAGYRANPSLKGYLKHLTAINGPGNLQYFVTWAWRYCPKPRLLPYLCWGIAARAGGYLRDWVRPKRAAG
jgi:GT2 family glycosyltransferase